MNGPSPLETKVSVPPQPPRSWSEGRRALGVQSALGVVVVGAIVVLLNLISARVFFKWDLTQGKRYTLSDASRKLAGSLKDDLIIRSYITGGLPQPWSSQARYVQDVLKEYTSAGRGKIRHVALDPSRDEKAQIDAGRVGVNPIRFNQVVNDAFQSQEGYLGVALFYQDKQEIISFVKDAQSLEYDISSRIKKMTSSGKKIIGLVEGHAEKTPGDLQKLSSAAMLESFDVKSLRLSTATAYTPSIIVLLGPRQRLTDDELKYLDASAEKGIPLVVYINRRIVNSRAGFFTYVQSTGLEPYLEHYGIKVSDDFVLDPAQCQRVTLQTQQGGVAIITQWAAMPLSNALNKSHPTTKYLDVLGFPFAHALIPSVPPGSGLKVTALAESSPYSYIPAGISRLDPYSLPGPVDKDLKGPFFLAAVSEGTTKSFFSPEKTIPHFRMVVVGTSYGLDPELPNPAVNGHFFISLLEWLSQDENILSIPSKEPSFRPLKNIPDGRREAVKYLGFIFLPALVILGGVLRLKRRNVQKAAVEGYFRKN